MAQATTKSRPAAKVPPTHPRGVAASRRATLIDRSAELSEDVLNSLEAGQHSAIEAVRKFVDSVDQTLPHRGEGPSRRQEIVDSALDLTDRLVETQHDFIRRVIESTAKSLSDGAK